MTTGQTYSLPGSISGSATRIDVAMTGHPDGLYSRTYVGESGWKEGLTLATEDCIGTNCSDRKRWTWTDWAQDNEGLPYVLNPRVEETRVGDGTNTKRTTIGYWLQGTGSDGPSVFGLVKSAFVYGTDLSTVLKKTYTEYQMASAYTSRRIIGLPSLVSVWGSETTGLNLMSKVTYGYDEGNFSDSSLNQSITPVQHDTNYDATFIVGRGNLTSTTRWDATAENNSGLAITSSTKYNTAGSPVAQITPWDGTNTRTVRIGYADSFNSTVGVSTYAYPTLISDPAASSLGDTNHSSTVTYRYDIGVNIRAESPAPQGQSTGKITERKFDVHGRLEKASVVNTGAYTRYEYPSNGIQSKVYSTIIDTDNDGADADDEVLSETFTDGAGRVRLSRVPHTFSSGATATWAGTITEYDILGRVYRQSIPTEVNSSWSATGDDLTRGFLWTYQKYDWMNRVIRKINTDGLDQTAHNDSDILISYEGCGCAGGQVTTVLGEKVVETDYLGNGPVTKGRRKKKIYEDVLGRTVRSEIYDWDGSTILTFAVNSFNGRDQILQTLQYDGATTDAPYQTTSATFDGFGRLWKSHAPQQKASNSTATYTTYGYNPDATVSSVDDARSARTSYSYNSRGMVSGISWTVPNGSGISVPGSVTFDYDNAGNRISADDQAGYVSYQYDSLSQLTSETRYFDDNLLNAPLVGNEQAFRIAYAYSLSGAVSSYTDPYGNEVAYAKDRAGKLSGVTGTSFGGVTSYASGAHYRAWGALAGLNYGDTTSASVTFDDSLRASTFNLQKSGTDLIGKTYSYYKDGNLKYVGNSTTTGIDSLYKYDALARMTSARSGAEAHGETVTDLVSLPYRQNISYNGFDNITLLDLKRWNYDLAPESKTYLDNRIVGEAPAHPYDADGRDLNLHTYNASGRPDFQWNGGQMIHRYYDGDGEEVRRGVQTYEESTAAWTPIIYGYFIRSSVLGGRIVTEVDTTGRKAQTYVLAEGAILARQSVNLVNSVYVEDVAWEHRDAAQTEVRYTDSSGAPSAHFYSDNYDPLGRMTGTRNLVLPQTSPNRLPSPFREVPPDMGAGPCQVEIDGILQSCSSITIDNTQVADFRGPDKLHPTISALDNRLPGVLRAWIPGQQIDDVADVVGENYVRITTHETPGRWEVIGSWNFGYAASQTRHGPKLGEGVPENLKDLVLGLTAYGECGEVFEQLIQTSSKKYKEWQKKSQKSGKSIIETMYDSLKSVNINPKRSAEGTNAGGHVELGDYNNDPRGLFATQQRFALITLQETIHQVFDDDALQRASEKLYDSGKLDPAIKSKVDRKNLYEHALLSAACGRTDQELTNGRPTP